MSTSTSHRACVSHVLDAFARPTWPPNTDFRPVPVRRKHAQPDTCEDGEGNDYTRRLSYTLRCPSTDVPKFLCYYDELRLEVPCDDPTIVECMAIENFNTDLRQKKRNYIRQLEDVMYKFSTLNQLLKAAPYIKDLVPQDKLTKMYEKDDRSGRRAELAEVADSELQELREVLLEDALLGDD